MLKELVLKDWKSFAEATLYIDPLTVLIGSNASGKSNALDALLFLSRVSSGVGIFSAIAGDMNISPLRGGVEWVCRKPEKRFSLSVLVDGEREEQEYRYTLAVRVNGTKAEVYAESLKRITYPSGDGETSEKVLFYTGQDGVDSPVGGAYFSTGIQGREKRLDLNRDHTILAQAEALSLERDVMDGVKNVASQLSKIFILDPIPSHMRHYTALSDTLLPDGSNIAGVLGGLEGERKTAVEDAVTGYVKGIPERDIKRIWVELVGKFGIDAMLYCQEGWENQPFHEVDARSMSDGTLRYLAIVAALLTRESHSLLVIEEVDSGLHPSRSHLLIDMLQTLGRERMIDVLVTTHNPALLDAAGVSMVPYITVVHRDDVTGYSKLTQLEDIEQLPKLMAAGSLGRLSTEGRIESALKQECLL